MTCASSWNYILEYCYNAQTHEHKINSVSCASSWNCILEYCYNAQTHEHKKRLSRLLGLAYEGTAIFVNVANAFTIDKE